MDYYELKEKFQKQFDIEYENFINKQIIEVQNSFFFVDISRYTSITVTEPQNMVQNFLNAEKINDQMLGSLNDSFRLKLSLLLEIETLDQRRKLDTKLFNEIVRHNTKFLDK
ncbi:hypothetical protein BAS10_17805 [Elizabethkingia meningoseptica]|uniref:hypothetical protein n=1 Tax=Elizabethkingia meningoseptica TaxID=238 RepID=UPI0009992F2E|nr:hypothetical protein [Elizabethkingia meningoseptica]OPC03171.1 hypothetical protein BAS10_17805 [Elizabethkingia meningoseptica]